MDWSHERDGQGNKKLQDQASSNGLQLEMEVVTFPILSLDRAGYASRARRAGVCPRHAHEVGHERARWRCAQYSEDPGMAWARAALWSQAWHGTAASWTRACAGHEHRTAAGWTRTCTGHALSSSTRAIWDMKRLRWKVVE